MSREMDPTHETVIVERVENGWVLRSGVGLYGRDGSIASSHVASTPRELASLLETWAQAQSDPVAVAVNIDELMKHRPGGRFFP